MINNTATIARLVTLLRALKDFSAQFLMNVRLLLKMNEWKGDPGPKSCDSLFPWGGKGYFEQCGDARSCVPS